MSNDVHPIRKWLATLLDPKMAEEQEAYWRLWHRTDEVRNWCGVTQPKAAAVAQFLLEPNGRGIRDFRAWLDETAP